MTVFFLLLVLAQDSDCRSCEVLSGMASALSENNSTRFMDFIDRSAPDRSGLQTNVDALTSQNQITCSIDVLEEKGDDEQLNALVDWYIVIRPNQASAATERRRMRVHLTEKKRKRDWKVTDIEPRSILAPLILAP